jgi:IrrE N-terminal-like domain
VATIGSLFGHGRDQELRRRCQEIVDGLDIPDPFSIRDLVRLLGQRRGRPIHLVPLRLPAGEPCGVWVSTRDFDVIFYEADTSPLHQEHIIAHELGHVLCEHGASTIDAHVSRQLLPDLDPQLVRRILHRTTYSKVEERQAEVVASLISRAANRPRSRSGGTAPPDVADVLARVEHTLERRPRGAPHE